MIPFYGNLNITIKVVLQVNGLNHNPQIESNMFQSMFMIPVLLQGHLLLLKDQLLDHFCF